MAVHVMCHVHRTVIPKAVSVIMVPVSNALMDDTACSVNMLAPRPVKNLDVNDLKARAFPVRQDTPG